MIQRVSQSIFQFCSPAPPSIARPPPCCMRAGNDHRVRRTGSSFYHSQIIIMHAAMPRFPPAGRLPTLFISITPRERAPVAGQAGKVSSDGVCV